MTDTLRDFEQILNAVYETQGNRHLVHTVVYHWYDHEGTERTTLHSIHSTHKGAQMELIQLAYSDYGLYLDDDAVRFAVPEGQASDPGSFFDIEQETLYQ